jgi:acyl carrier protein
VEPAEVRAALLAHPSVHDALVDTFRDARGQTALDAYVVAAAGAALTAGELRERLRTQLPAYMVPASLTVLEAFPLTPNGKIDRRRLERRSADAEADRAAPLTDAERALAAIWTDVLGCGRVGPHDSFFDLGGSSLAAVQIIGQVQAALAIDLPFEVFFSSPTLAAMAKWIAAARVTLLSP